MKIAGTEINLAFRALEIYVSGCLAPHCRGCHNSELWDFTAGDPYDAKIGMLKDKARDLCQSGLADYAWMLGGEPLDQDVQELCRLLDEMKECGLKNVLWTHYYRVPENVLQRVEFVKMGPYQKDGIPWTEPVFGVKLANREQAIFPAEYVREMQEKVEAWQDEMLSFCSSDFEGDSKMSLAYGKLRVLDRFWASIALSRVADSPRPLALQSALNVFAHLDWEEAGMFAFPHALKALDSDDPQTVNLALHCFRHWDQPMHLKWLEGRTFKEKLLEDGRRSVVEWLKKVEERQTASAQEG